MLRLFLSFIAIFLSASSAGAGEAERLLLQGNAAFQKKEYLKARECYEKVLGQGYQSAALEHNLGMAWHHLGKRGEALLHLERAALLAPRDSDILHNLGLLRAAVAPGVESAPEFFLARIWRQAQELASTSAMATAGLALWWAGMAGLARWLLGRSRRQKKTGFIGGLALILLSLLPFALAGSRAARQLDSQAAILLVPAPLRSGPEQAGPEILRLPEGAKVQLTAFLDGWWQVQLANGEAGWLEMKVLEEI